MSSNRRTNFAQRRPGRGKPRRRNNNSNSGANSSSISMARIGTLTNAPGVQGEEQLTLPRMQKTPAIRFSSRESVSFATDAGGIAAANIPLFNPNTVFSPTTSAGVVNASDFAEYADLYEYYKIQAITIQWLPTIAATTAISPIYFGMTLEPYTSSYTAAQITNLASASVIDARRPAQVTFRVPRYASFRAAVAAEATLAGGWLSYVASTTVYDNGAIVFRLSGGPVSTALGTFFVQYDGKWKAKQ